MKSSLKETFLPPQSSGNAGSILPHEHRAIKWSTTALIDGYGVVVATDNPRAAALHRDDRPPVLRMTVGANYFDQLRNETVSWQGCQEALRGMEAVLSGNVTSFTLDYYIRLPIGARAFRLSVLPLKHATIRLSVSHIDITDLQRSRNKQVQRTTQHLITAHEEERHRIAQQIHSEVGNRIAVIAFSLQEKMKAEQTRVRAPKKGLDDVLADIIAVATNLREISQNLYPASLRYAGIGAALKTLRDSFEKSHRLKVQLVIPASLPSLPQPIQLAIFRTCEEAFHNVVVRSGATKAKIQLEILQEAIRLTVSDNGKEFHVEELLGDDRIGLTILEERALSVGGHLRVQSLPRQGTEILLTIPLRASVHSEHGL